MVMLHPNVLEADGVKQFVVLPYNEFQKLKTELDDYYDLLELRKAKSEEATAPTMSMQDLKKKLRVQHRAAAVGGCRRRRA